MVTGSKGAVVVWGAIVVDFVCLRRLGSIVGGIGYTTPRVAC